MIDLVNAILQGDTSISGSALVLWLALANHADKSGYCWPGVTRLARQCRVSERQATRLVAQLEAARVVEVKRVNGRSNGYIVHAAPFAPPDIRVTPDTHVTPVMGVTPPLTPVSPTPDTHVTPPPTPMSPESPYKHHVTNKETSAPPEKKPGDEQLKLFKAAMHGYVDQYVFKDKIEPLRLVSWDGAIMQVGTDQEPCLQWLQSRAMTSMERAFAGIVPGGRVELVQL
jgi:hypothetical protein